VQALHYQRVIDNIFDVRAGQSEVAEAAGLCPPLTVAREFFAGCSPNFSSIKTVADGGRGGCFFSPSAAKKSRADMMSASAARSTSASVFLSGELPSPRLKRFFYD
jgi:hypothetical protein